MTEIKDAEVGARFLDIGGAVHNVMHPTYGAKFDGVTNDTAACQAAHDAMSNGDVMLLPGGSTVLGKVNITKRIKIQGSGLRKTTIVAASGVTTPIFNCDFAAVTTGFEISGFLLDLTNAPSATGIFISESARGYAERIQVHAGTVGLDITGTSTAFTGRDLTFTNQSTAGIRIDGDGGLEHTFQNVNIALSDASVTALTGFLCTRTTNTDTGALYLDTVRITRSAGTYANGFSVTSTQADTTLPLFMFNCVADNINSGTALNLSEVGLSVMCSNCWFLVTHSGGSAVTVTGGQSFQFINCYIKAPSDGYGWTFVAAPAQFVFVGNRAPVSTVFNIPALNPPVRMHVGLNSFHDAAALANDLTRFAAATGVGGIGHVISAHQVMTHPSGVGNQVWSLTEPGGESKYFRMLNTGQLQILNNAFDAILWRLDDNGDMTIEGDLNHDGSQVGFFGTAPASLAAAYTPTNVSPDRSYDADTVAVAELADIVGTMIADLKTYGLFQ